MVIEMYNIIRKKEYFSWLENGAYCDTRPRLKSVQDAYAISKLMQVTGCRIAEIGGGNSRVLDKIKNNNECWNIDKFEGEGLGPRDIKNIDNIKIVKSYIGDFSEELPEKYFDYVFSISVVEHVQENDLCEFFKDIERILKPGGMSFHAIDCYIGDEVSARPIWMAYLNSISSSCSNLKLLMPPSINEKTVFCSDMASDPDINMWMRNKIAPQLSLVRNNHQCVSIKCELVKSVSNDSQIIDDILIYSMGKVASSSVDRTLKKCGYNTKHFHYYEGDYNSEESSVYSQMNLVSLKNHDVKIVTLTRDPIARNISAFFQNIDKFCSIEEGMPDLSTLLDVFHSKYNHKIPLEWFDKEFKKNTGIDVYEYKFDKVKGYLVIEGQYPRVLIIKSEISDDYKLKGLQDFLCDFVVPQFILQSNRSENKNYAEVYKLFLQNVCFDENVVDDIYSSKYAKHFYTDEELNRFKSRWTKS